MKVRGRPGVEGLAHHGGGEPEQADRQERTTAQQRQDERQVALRAPAMSEHVRRVGDRCGETFIGARLAQEQQVRQEHRAGHCRAEHEQSPPRDAVRQQEAHARPCDGIADQVAAAEDCRHRAVARVVEPPGGDLDERRPADRLRQAVGDPGECEERQRATRGEQQREERRTAGRDQEVALATPVVAEAGEEPLAERVSEHPGRAHPADAQHGSVVAHTVRAQLLDQQRGRNRKIRAAEIAGRVAEEQQQHRAGLRNAQARCERRCCRGRRVYGSHGRE